MCIISTQADWIHQAAEGAGLRSPRNKGSYKHDDNQAGNTVITIERQWTQLLNQRRMTEYSTDDRGTYTWCPKTYGTCRRGEWEHRASHPLHRAHQHKASADVQDAAAAIRHAQSSKTQFNQQQAISSDLFGKAPSD